MQTTSPRRGVAGALAVVVALLMAGLSASPAAATAYRSWSYWQGATGTWVISQTGPADHLVVDSDVQGWRFAISTETSSPAPAAAPDFATLCPDLAATAPAEGVLRVAVVVDYGLLADAPSGSTPPANEVGCVTVPDGATGAQALAAAVGVTDQSGLVCALNGYPADECAVAVSDAEASSAAAAASAEAATPTDTPATDIAAADSQGSSASGFVLGAVVLAVLLVAAFVIPAQRRRRRAADQG